MRLGVRGAGSEVMANVSFAKNIPLSRKVACLKKEIGLVFGSGVCVLDSFVYGIFARRLLDTPAFFFCLCFTY